MRKNCYGELPEGYELISEVDAVGNKKLAILLNVAALVLTAISGVIVFFLRFYFTDELGLGLFRIPLDTEEVWQLEIYLFATVALMLVYTVLHELVHGVAYKILTGEKLTFGISLTCAYCGVPHVFVNRKTALISLLAPFTLFSVVFLLVGFLASGWVASLSLLLFAFHFGGCSGDLYDTFLFMTKLKGDILMKDTGPKQSFYKKK